MRDEGGRFAPELTREERAFFGAALGRADLRRILASPFGADGRPIGVTPEESRWAVQVVMDRPEWAKQTLLELGFCEEER